MPLKTYQNLERVRVATELSRSSILAWAVEALVLSLEHEQAKRQLVVNRLKAISK